MSSSTQLQATLKPWQVIVGGICALILTLGFARFLYTPMLPLLQAELGLSDSWAGFLAAANYAGYISGVLIVAWIDDARWRHRLYSVGLLLTLLTTGLMGFSSAPFYWILVRYFAGLCGAAGLILGSGLILGWLIRQQQRAELGVLLTGIGLGIVLSAVGVWALSHWLTSQAHYWWGFTLLSCLIFVPAWRWRPPVPTQVLAANLPVGAVRLQRELVVLSLSYFCAGWGFVISATFIVAIVERQSSLAGLGPLTWALVGLGAIPAVFLWDRVARRIGEVHALLVAFALQIGSIVWPTFSDSAIAALGGALLYGATFTGIVSLTLALVGRRAPHNPGKAMARLTLSYGAAQVIAPIIAGVIAQWSGHFTGALWLTVAVLMVGMGLLATLR